MPITLNLTSALETWPVTLASAVNTQPVTLTAAAETQAMALKTLEVQPILPTFTDFDTQIQFLADLAMEIDTTFRIFQEAQVCVSLVGDQFIGEETCAAKPTGKFPINEKDTKEIASLVWNKIFELESQKLATEKEEKLFAPEETENLHGEVEKDL